MENKKTTELMSRKSTLKSKLMAAVSMLLVSAIMVSVTTYAWFILSTAPEVKGMSTTVGSNGALEMALLNNATGTDLSKITSAVGDSSAKKSVVEANKTWGNLVDLNDASYGLSNITMYPARLNWKANSTDTLYSRNNLLSYAQYGTDGRIADLIAADSGTNTESGFVSDANSYGVRAIGTAKDQDPKAAALDAAKNGFRNEFTNAKGAALTALNGSGQDIANIAYTHAKTKGGTDTYTADQVKAIKGALEGLKTASDNIEKALKYAVVAKDASENKITAFDAVTLDGSNTLVGEYYVKLGKLRTAIDTALGQINSAVAGEGGKYAWAQIETPYKALFDISNMTLSGKTSTEIQGMSESELTDWALGMINTGKGLELNVSAGLFSDMANFVDTIVSTANIEVNVTEKSTIKATITVNKNTDVTEAHLVALQTTVNGYQFAGDQTSAKPFITDKYGYAVDLAFRSNAEGKLMLSKQAANRVNSDQTDTTLGGGCYFTANAKSDPSALAALRIAFVNDENKVLAVGKLDMDAEGAAAANKYPVHLYSFNVDDGVLKVSNTAVTDDVILNLKANEAVALTAVVFMDGDATSFAQNQASGSLNLQFVTSTTLKAMDYTNYANAGLTLDANAVKTVVVDSAVNVPKVYMNGVEVTNVTWSCEPTDVVEIKEGKITGKKAGAVKITATYAVGGKNHTASYDFTVTAN